MGDFSSVLWRLLVPLLVGWLILLPPRVGQDIMGYESEPFTSYPELSNFSYSVTLITPPPCLLPMFIYRVLIPPSHQPARPRHPLRLRSQCIDGAAGHPLHYGCLPPLDVHPDGVDLWGFYRLLYQWVLPLSACPTFSVIPVIHHAARWWNPVRTLIISAVTTQL